MRTEGISLPSESRFSESGDFEGRYCRERLTHSGQSGTAALTNLEMDGMSERMTHRPDELSGGQKQRVSIARAMTNDPSIILADEPTGALDSVTGRKIMDIFHKLHEEQGKTIVLITHSNELASETERIITLKDGCIIGKAPARPPRRMAGSSRAFPGAAPWMMRIISPMKCWTP